MGKHTRQKNNRIGMRALSTGMLAVGLLVTQTAGASAGVSTGAQNASSFERTAVTTPLDMNAINNSVAVQVPATATSNFDMQATAGVIQAPEPAAAPVAEAAPVAQEAVAAPAAPAATAPLAAQPVAYNAAATPAPVAQTPQAPVTQAPSTGRSAAIYGAAMAQLGVNQDCTMLATNALAAAGINFHDWPAGYMSLGTITNNPVPGDLIYYADGGMGMAHIAVYAGNGMAVHGGFNGNSTAMAPAQLGSGAVFIHVA